MSGLLPYLSIAGLAYRQAQELQKVIADDHHCFPRGDMSMAASEIACCEAILAMVRALFAPHLKVLEFSSEGKAIARMPQDLLEKMDQDEIELVEP